MNISGDVTKVWVTVVYCITNLVALIVPPTFKSPPIPTPPTTVKAPVLVDVDAELAVTATPGELKIPGPSHHDKEVFTSAGKKAS